jgi:hypothetical protein
LNVEGSGLSQLIFLFVPIASGREEGQETHLLLPRSQKSLRLITERASRLGNTYGVGSNKFWTSDFLLLHECFCFEIASNDPRRVDGITCPDREKRHD